MLAHLINVAGSHGKDQIVVGTCLQQEVFDGIKGREVVTFRSFAADVVCQIFAVNSESICLTGCMYISKDKSNAVVFAFDIHPRYGERLLPVRLQGLEANRMYKVKEINLMPGAWPSLGGNDQVYSGEYLMTVGLGLFTGQDLSSRIIEVSAQ